MKNISDFPLKIATVAMLGVATFWGALEKFTGANVPNRTIVADMVAAFVIPMLIADIVGYAHSLQEEHKKVSGEYLPQAIAIGILCGTMNGLVFLLTGSLVWFTGVGVLFFFALLLGGATLRFLLVYFGSCATVSLLALGAGFRTHLGFGWAILSGFLFMTLIKKLGQTLDRRIINHLPTMPR